MHHTIFVAIVGLLVISMPALAQTVDIDVPGTRVQVDGSGGTLVQVPGVTVDIPTGTELEIANEPEIAVVPPAASRAVPRSGSYVNADLQGMDFSGQNLAQARFTNANLQGASFRQANLTGADFSNADLSHADLSGANLTGANLTNASLGGAILIGTIMVNATLTNADMTGVIRQAVVAPPPIVNAVTIRQKLQAPVKPGEQAKIDLTVNFDFNSDRLTADGIKQVAEIAAALNDPAMAKNAILIEGHTDSIGSDAYNQKLSERRAERVRQTLINQYSVLASHLKAQGFGESRPVASNDNDLGRAKNRRVTLVNLDG